MWGQKDSVPWLETGAAQRGCCFFWLVRLTLARVLLRWLNLLVDFVSTNNKNLQFNRADFALCRPSRYLRKSLTCFGLVFQKHSMEGTINKGGTCISGA